MSFGWSTLREAMKIIVATRESIERPLSLPESVTYLNKSNASWTQASLSARQLAISLILWCPWLTVQSIVDIAVRSDHICSSLFPLTIVDRPKSCKNGFNLAPTRFWFDCPPPLFSLLKFRHSDDSSISRVCYTTPQLWHTMVPSFLLNANSPNFPQSLHRSCLAFAWFYTVDESSRAGCYLRISFTGAATCYVSEVGWSSSYSYS